VEFQYANSEPVDEEELAVLPGTALVSHFAEGQMMLEFAA
jgi:hypothetical protein